MRALAAYIMRGPVQAILVTAALSLVSLVPILGVISVLSGAAVALVTLRHGLQQGLMVLIGAGLVNGVFLYFALGSPHLALIYAGLLWVPLVVMALVLRGSGSWSMVLDAAAVMGLVGIGTFYTVQADPLQFWQAVLSQTLQAMSAESGLTEMEQLEAQIPLIAEWMTGMLTAGLVLGLVLSLMVARWWQALLYNPGGFRKEFYALRQSRSAAMVVLLILAISIVDIGTISYMAGDAMIMIVVLYSIAGLALVHALVETTGKQSGWLVAVYVALFLVTPHVMVVLASLGFADSWMNFRGRFAGIKKDSGKRNDKQ